MQVRVLGEIEVDAEAPVALGGPIQRRILSALAIRRGEVVSVSWLADVVWPDGNGPARAEHNIRTYVHRLRTALGDDGVRIETVGSGYRLQLNVEELDAAHFEWLADAAASAAERGDAVGALEHIGRAERLWLGTPLEEFEHEPWATPAVVRLRERRANLRERRAAALIEVGRPTDAIEVLHPLVREEPLRERPRALLMTALYGAGRQPEALRVFQEFRTYLLDEIGVQPSSELVALDRAIASGSLPETHGPSAGRVGAYALHEPVGVGAFAIVHRATQSSLGREVAIKIIRAEFANEPEFIRRFEAEAQMVARIEHANIVPLYDYWREPDRALLAMRWMSGGSLARRLGEAWSADDALVLVDQIAAALEVAHRHGVIHRDVKPENILFDAAGRAHLGDFGIAIEAARALPALAAASGSPTFAPPEQRRLEAVGPEADVYALAMVTSLLLTGGKSSVDSDAGIREVLAIATAERPADRYQSAEAFALALRVAASRPATLPVGTGGVGTNPFKGLNPFVEADAADFHGRDRLVAELVKRLGDHDHLLAVVGPSGSGKSSVVRAGLVPALRDGRVPGSSRWFVTTMIPGDQPFEALETALLRVAVNPPVELLAQLCDGPRGLLRSARRILPDDDGVVLLIIDQFEELFASAVSTADRDLFLQAVAVAVTEPASPLRVVLTLRADFFDRPLRHPHFAPLIKGHTVAVAPLAPDELEQAIVTPAARVGVGFEPGLVSEIVADVNRHPAALPLMQYALTNAFETSDRTTITIDDYRAIGGLTGALAQRAEAIWQSATPEEQVATRRLFGRLVTLGEGREDTRRRVVRNELDPDPATNAMVERYGVGRLLAFDHDPATREPTLEVAHEAVLREWPRLRAWLDEDRDALRVHRHLTAAATGWVESGRDSSELYGGSRLAAAEGLLADRTALNPVETEFLEASLGQRAELEASQHRRARRRWYLTTSIAIIAALAIIASVVALRQRDRADAQAVEARSNAALAVESGQLAETRAEEADQARQEVEAEKVRADRAAEEAESGRRRAEEATAAGDLQRLEAQAVRSVDVDPGLAALLAVEANRISGGSPSSADALQRVLSSTGGVEVRFPGVYGESRLSRDGATLVAFELRHVDVWDLPTRTLLHREEIAAGGGTLTSFDITADARLVAYVNLNGTHLLEVATGELTSVSDAVTPAIAFTSDGRELAVANGNTVEFWDVTSPSSPRLVDRRTFGASPVSHIAWNPTDDGYALVKDATQVIEYWHRNDAEPAWTYTPTLGGNGRAGIPATLFSSDGTSLIVANGEQKGSGAVVRKYATSDGAPYATSGGEEIPPAANTPASLNDLIWSDEPNGLVVGTLLPTGVFALDLSSGDAISPPFEAPNAAWIGYSPALQRYVTSGLQGIEIRRRGSGPLERVVTLTPEQQAALDDGGAMYASISADANTAVAAVFHIPRHPQTVAFDLTTDPPAPREMGEQLLPVAVGDYTLMASPTTPTATGEIVMLDADLEPVGAPIETPTCTRMWKPSPDGRFFAVYCEYGSVNLYRSSGELVKAGLLVPDATPPWELVRFSFTSDGSRLFGYMQLGELQWAIWDTETGSLLDHGTRDELQRPIVVDDTLYVQRGVADFSLLQLDPDTFEPVGPPLVESLFTLSEIAGDGRGELVAVTGLDGITHVFDTATGSQLGREISGNRNPNASFAADGTTLLVQSDDHISVWNYDRTSWPDIACTLAGRNLTREEWEEWGPRTIEYRPTCPQFPADDAA